MHPLTPDLTTLTDAELQQKISELSTKLTQSYRFGNAQLVGQIQMVLADYSGELQRRQQKMMDDMMAKSDKFSGIIDIK
jgi:hypothetical protein